MTDKTGFVKEQKLNTILKRIPDRFLLILAVAKRARQLKDGTRPFVPVLEENAPPILVAMDELYAGKISVSAKEKKKSNEDLLEAMEVGAFEEEDATAAAEEKEKKPKEKTKTKAKSRSLSA
jgi:DNA-directed RNA polymerase omega subunit